MGRVAAIGESVRIQGLALAGVALLPGDDPGEVISSWESLSDEVGLVILTPTASSVLGPRARDRLAVVMPP